MNVGASDAAAFLDPSGMGLSFGAGSVYEGAGAGTGTGTRTSTGDPMSPAQAYSGQGLQQVCVCM